MAATDERVQAELLMARRAGGGIRRLRRIHDHQRTQVRQIGPDRAHLRRLLLVGRDDDGRA